MDFVRQVITDDLKEVVPKSGNAFSARTEWLSAYWSWKAICLNFGIAEEFDGLCNLRFDDTNPDAEEQEYI